VDTTDSDLDPTYTGYGPTTQTEYAVSVSGGQVYNLADFGFGPSLQIDKILLSSDPAYEGEDVTFRIGLTNKLPGDGTASGFCRYTIWATTAYVDNANSPPGGNTAGKQWANTGNGLGAPDNQYTTTDMADASETIGLSGFDMGDQGGTITDVEVVIYFQEQQDFVTNSNLFVRTWDDGLGGALNTYTFSNVYFGGPDGTKYVIQQNVFADRAVWNWSHFAPNTTELQIEANKGSGPDGGEAAVDAVAYIVTTDQTCGGADSTIITLPVTDTYDADLLQFVSASPANSASTTSGTPPNTVGTINWANMGPLYGGQTKYITVTFTALDPGASTVNTINTADVTGAFFGNGRPVNDDDDDADVDIIPIGSIAGTVYSDGNSNGWQGTTGYDSLDTNDFGIPNVTVSLFGCYTANPASGGVLFTNVSITQACTGQAGGSNDNR
jgi:hypothetical protein